jgi:hypothetical protein
MQAEKRQSGNGRAVPASPILSYEAALGLPAQHDAGRVNNRRKQMWGTALESLSGRDGQAAVPAPSPKLHREAPVGAADPETAQATGCCSYPRREGYRRIPANAA